VHLRTVLLLAIAAVGPTLAFVAVSEIWYPRYLLFTTVPLLPLAALGFVTGFDLVRGRVPVGRPMATMLAAVALAAVLWPALRFDLWLWTDPARAPFPALDRFQYVTGWPSGYGARDTIAFLRDERARHPGLLLVTPGPSTTASAVRLLWTRDASLDVRYVDPAETTPSALAAPGQGVLVVVSLIEGVRLPERWAPELVLAFSSFKPDGAPADQVYRLVSAGDGR